VIGASALRRRAWRHPEAAAAGVAVLAWVWLLVPTAAGAGSAHGPEHHTTPVLPSTAGWLVMVAAMMLPGALPAARELALGGRWSRRQRTTALFLGGYVGVWAAFGTVAHVAAWLAGRGLGIGSAVVLPGLLAAAALWQLSPWKWRAVRACHLLRPLPPRGVRADAACAGAALRYGRWCVVSCWPVMAAMATASSSLWLMVLLTVLVTAEKLAAEPSRLAWPGAAVLAGAAAVVLPGWTAPG
jgi:predicted metal-binding membrane protein